VFNGALGKKGLMLAFDTCLQRWPNEVVEEERAIYKQSKAKDL
jgi:hypothetical protein